MDALVFRRPVGNNAAQPRRTRPVSAQQSSRDTGSHPERQITIDVDVTDKKGNPAAGLQQQDFILLDDKRPLSIVSFHAYSPKLEPEDPPQAIIAVDEVNIGF